MIQRPGFAWLAFRSVLRGSVPMRRWGVEGLKRLGTYGLAALLLLAIDRTGIAEALDLLLYDLITTLRPAPAGTDHPITIIGISESDIAERGWPIDDSLLCRAIDRLLAGGALAVGMDLYRDRGVGREQECLRQRFRDEPRLVSIFNVADTIRPVPGTPANRQGFNDLVVDADGVVRRDLVHVAGQDEATVSFPLRMVEVATGSAWIRHQLEQGSAPGPWLHPDAGGYSQVDAAGYQQMMVYRRPGSFHAWTLGDLLAEGRIPADQIRDHIVLIGSTAPSLRDVFPVPHTRFVPGEAQLLVPGVEVHAHRLAALLDRRNGDASLRILTLSRRQELLVELAAVAAGILLGEGFARLRRSVLYVGLAGTLLVTVVVLLELQHVWVGLSVPLAALLLMASAAWLRRGAVGLQQRQQFERLLGQTTSPAVARQLWELREDLLSDGRFEGRQLPVTIVMADICGFTTVSERFTPRELLDWLNRGMACSVPVIIAGGGMVNKFTGDGFLAVFGAPLSRGADEDARAAIAAVVEIQQRLEALNRDLKSEGAPHMRMRIGVHSGEVLAGSMGSSERLEYAVIGDAVNCASRLEALEKERHTNTCRVLVSSTTRDLLGDAVPTMLWVSWGPMKVKGRDEPIEVWELWGPVRDNAREAVPATPH
ncbi:MAG: adenylate/guanylate cyclase domain-containing protein [Synechococcaceae cyanobacterium]|nr:adenylate/guanylate cyclase domain-containing protein [Synechococcaceae cyanobacterium]